MQSPNPPGAWRSRSTFVFALAGAAVGLGNLWRFAYLLGSHGGTPFLVAYLATLLLVAVPVVIAEVAIGSLGRAAPPMAWSAAARRARLGAGWGAWGLLAAATALGVLGYGAVVGGWSLTFAWHLARGTFAAASPRDVSAFLEGLLAAPWRMLAWQSLFLATAVAVSAAGVRRGLGALAWLVVPSIMALFWLLIDFALAHGDLAAAQAFLFSTQPLDFRDDVLFVAFGQALFTLGAGLAVGISYGGYAPERQPLGRSVLAVAVFDSAAALAAGVAIFPVIFANNIAPDMGPALLFVSLPYAFGNLREGDAYGMLFFLLVALAALGTAVALLEPAVATLCQRLRWRRWQSALAVGLVAWLLALAVAFSLAPGSPFAGFLPLLEQATTAWLIPVGALAVATFVGWCMDPALLRRELYRESDHFFQAWLLQLRFVAPLVLLVVWFWLAASGG
ncbi:MAG: sodium-dependent transporter [Pseudohaliea sp.]